MRVVGLFSGIGGFEIGLSQAGHETVMTSDVLPAARAVTLAKLPSAEARCDVRDIDVLPAGTQIVAAGFPCQDLSQAGKTKGLAGTQSSLVGEVFRLAARSDVPWLVLENVPFMLRLGGGGAMRTIVAALEGLGYRWAWRVVDSFGFGLPQRRERVYIVASRREDPSDVLLSDEVSLARPATAVWDLAHGFFWTEGRTGLGWAVDAVPTLKVGSGLNIASPPAILMPDGSVITPDIRDAERMQGFPEDWTLPAVEAGAKAGARWGLVGNSVSVPVAAWVGGRLESPGSYDRSRDRAFPDRGALPRAARFDGTRRYGVEIGPDPIGERSGSLAAFLRHSGKSLSPRATAGFLSRARRGNLRLAPELLPALEMHMLGDLAVRLTAGARA